MKPGIYEGIDIREYHRGPGISRSKLMLLERGVPADVRWALDHPEEREPTPALQRGTAIHYAILEPEEFERHVVVRPAFAGADAPEEFRGKGARERVAAWKEEHEGKVQVTQEEHDNALRIADMVRRLKGPAEALRTGKAELSLYWHDREVLLKARPDFLDTTRGMVVDVKTTVNGLDDKQVARTLADHGAAVQMAMILDGLDSVGDIGWPPFAPYLLMIQATGHLDIRLVDVSEWIPPAQARYQGWLGRWAESVKADRYETWHDRGVTKTAVPAWYS